MVCDARWKGGFAMIALNTWDIVGGISPPADLVEWVKSNAQYLWDQWAAHNP
jgi:hypothetical protein